MYKCMYVCIYIYIYIIIIINVPDHPVAWNTQTSVSSSPSSLLVAVALAGVGSFVTNHQHG